MSKSNAGAAYTYKLYFYAEVDSPNGREYSMRNEEILVKLGTLTDTSEKIEEIWYYTNPLNNLQLYKGAVKPTGLDTLWGNAHHAYIVFKTQSWWWSIEKNDAGITIQRSKKIEFVRDKYHRTKRPESFTTGIGCEKSKQINNRTVKQLVEFIQRKRFVDEEYDVFLKNCQDFADKIYDEFF